MRAEGLGLQAHARKFPTGMKDLARYIRARGLELGLYTTSGNFTCAGEVGSTGSRSLGSGGHQREDVDLWVREWGVTYVKHCLCNTTAEIRRQAFPTMRRAIDAAQAARRGDHSPGTWKSDAPQAPQVVYECANYPDRPWEGQHFEGCNVWRVSADVPDSFQGWTAVLDQAVADDVNRRAGAHGAGGQDGVWGGGWSSFDYLRIREGGGQTLEQYRAQMSMWAVLGAPLFIGVDVRTLSDAALAIYKNADVIAVSQDPAGVVGYRLYQDAASQVEVWVRPLSPSASSCRRDVRQGATSGRQGADETRWTVQAAGDRPYSEGPGTVGGGAVSADGVMGAVDCQPRAALVLLNRSPRQQTVRVTLQQLVQGTGLESWGDVLRSQMLAPVRVSVRDLWKHAGPQAFVGVDAGGEARAGIAGPAGNELAGALEVAVGATTAFMGVATLLSVDPIITPLPPGEEHAVWGG